MRPSDWRSCYDCDMCSFHVWSISYVQLSCFDHFLGSTFNRRITVRRSLTMMLLHCSFSATLSSMHPTKYEKCKGKDKVRTHHISSCSNVIHLQYLWPVILSLPNQPHRVVEIFNKEHSYCNCTLQITILQRSNKERHAEITKFLPVPVGLEHYIHIHEHTPVKKLVLMFC